MKSIQDKVAVVTGAGSGIGHAVAMQLASAGARVAVLDINEASARDVAAACPGGRATGFCVDISDKQAVQRTADAVRGALGAPAILVNNAGVMIKTRPFIAVPDEELERSLSVNLWGALHCTRAFLPDLLRQPEGSIVNVASLAGIAGFIHQVPYSTGKFALRGFSEALRMELLDTGVRVTIVLPGAVTTDILANSPYYTSGEKAILQPRIDRIPKVTAERAATKIVGAVRSGKGRVLVGADTIVIDKLVRLFPALYVRMLHAPVKKMLGMSSVDG